MRTLIMEDIASNRQYLKAVLQRFGEVVEAENGKQGLAVFHQAHQASNPFKVIFLDLFMPQCDGFTVAREIRQWEQAQHIAYANRVKLIVTTGVANTEQVLLIYRLGCDLYLPKPFTIGQITGFMKEIGYHKIANYKQ